jgi:hypothetical protein
MCLQIQMNDIHMQNTIDDDYPYEILELNVSEPIIFQGNRKNQQMYNEKDKQVILVVPREI